MISILSPLSNRQRNAPSPVIRSTHSPANTMSSTTNCLLYNSVPRINPKFLHFLNELPIAYIIHLYGPDSFQNSTFDIRVSPILVAKNLAKQREREGTELEPLLVPLMAITNKQKSEAKINKSQQEESLLFFRRNLTHQPSW